MDIEDLSKTQLLLLTLLVNFVTSIATGVLTVSLLDESAPTVTQTVNRIVERTIESVASETPLPMPIPGVIEKPVIVTEEELLTGAIAAASSRTVSIERNGIKIGTGVYLPKSRAIATLTTPNLPREVVVAFPGGVAVEASRSQAGPAVTIYGFSDTAALPEVSQPKLISFDALKAGQTVVGITAERSAVRGIISRVDASGILTTLPATPAGSAAVNLSGDIIGISAGSAGSYVSAENIATLLAGTSTPPVP